MATERRTNPRIDVRRRVRVEVEGFTGQVTLVNVSPGGFGVASTEPIGGDDPKTVCFAAQDGHWVISVPARIAYSRPHTDERTGANVHLAGFSFANLHTPAVSRVVDQLLERIAGVLV